jgi:hypothetical protein
VDELAERGAVVLDIGGDVGALVVSTPEALLGAELEICPAGKRGQVPDEGGAWWDGDWRADHGGPGHAGPHTQSHGPAWPHVSVLRRPGAGPAAVFPGLRDGAYEVWVRPDGPSRVVVRVAGGEVTAVDWPDDPQRA